MNQANTTKGGGNKPLKRKNYGSIPHLSTSKLGESDRSINIGQERMATLRKKEKQDRVIVLEKYDGVNVGVAKINCQIVGLMRHGYTTQGSPYKSHQLFEEWLSRNIEIFDEILDEGDRIVGEWMYYAVGLKYVIAGDPIVFFDYFKPGNIRLKYFDFICRTNGLPIKTARIIHNGEPIETTKLLPELNKKDPLIRSIDEPEGMVYRVESDEKVKFLAKWVRHSFVPGKYLIDVPESQYIINKCYE